MPLDQPVSAVARAGATVERVLGDAATAVLFQRVAVAVGAAQYVRVGVVFAQAGALGAEEGAPSSPIRLWGLVVVSVWAVLFAIPERRHAVKEKNALFDEGKNKNPF